MNKYILLGLLAVVGVALAESTAIVITKTITLQIDTVNDTTNLTYQYVFSIPQPQGQLQDSLTYSVDPSAATVSNDVASRSVILLGLVGAVTNNITVQMP